MRSARMGCNGLSILSQSPNSLSKQQQLLNRAKEDSSGRGCEIWLKMTEWEHNTMGGLLRQFSPLVLSKLNQLTLYNDEAVRVIT